MKQKKRFFMAMFTVTFCLLFANLAQAAKSPQTIINDSVLTLKEMLNQNDVGAMGDTLRGAKGVAIFPSVVKAGFVLGGRFGEGLILRKEGNSWNGPSFVDMAGASFGLQIGVQSTALVLVITNERGMQGFVGDKITLGGDVSVAAGPVGREAQAATDGKLQASIYSYSMSKGLFAGMSLEGASISTQHEKNTKYWGKTMLPSEILKTRASKKDMAELLQALNNLISKSSK
ncbi:MAG TPA: lipid-binding SYLF domain-containing protein [Synergistaceae bacterium]|nr:lipid-binding SYLF domain-containing protein [Synergistaceae bacterium]HPJ26861.1 lipid-binding SYLF domain-containing protein [Synergistaceae bacterium]HPQ38256.1 lipid-binding SYLF domain-containing protein [Synergistaceae bacterium]